MNETITTVNVHRIKLFKSEDKQSCLNINCASNRIVGDKKFTDWINAKIWGERAEKVAQYITQGTRLLLRGRTEARCYKAKDGTYKPELVLHVDHIEILASARRGQEAPPTETPSDDDED